MKRWKIPEERQVPLLVFVVGLLMIVCYLCLVTRPGLRYKDVFFVELEENRWHGTVLGEEASVVMEKIDGSTTLTVSCESGMKCYRLEGDSSDLTLYADGEKIFRGSYRDGFLWDEHGALANGNVLLSVQTSDNTYYYDEAGNQVVDTPLHLENNMAVWLLLGHGETTRGNPWMALIAAVFLSSLVLDLWFPQLAYDLTIRRWINGNPQPSDYYYVTRSLGHIVVGTAFLICLGIGLLGA